MDVKGNRKEWAKWLIGVSTEKHLLHWELHDYKEAERRGIECTETRIDS